MSWIDLDEVKEHLNKTSDDDDEELEGFITAACAVVEDLKGHVDVVTVTQTAEARSFLTGHRHGPQWDHVLMLTDGPVLAITTVEMLPGDGTTSTVAAQNYATGVDYGWRLEADVLHLPFRSGRLGGYRVTYTVGRDPVPGNYRLAALELVAHMWRNTQLTAQPPRGAAGDIDPEFIRGMAYALPFRVRELLGIYGSTVGPVGGVTLA